MFIYVCFVCVVKGIYDIIVCFYFLDDIDMNDCGVYYSLLLFLLSGLYRIKFFVVGYVIVLCEMDIGGGGWIVSVLFRKCCRCLSLCCMKCLYKKVEWDDFLKFMNRINMFFF